MIGVMLSTVRGIFREGHVELEEAPPRRTGRVLVVFLGDDPEDLVLEAAEPIASSSAAGLIDVAWPRELVEQLMGAPDELIERNQPVAAERKDLEL